MTSTAPSARVAVIGASGHTGRFVVAELARRGATPLPTSRSGRFSPIGGGTEKCAAVDVTDPASLDHVLARADAVVNCAGPFFDTAEPVARAAIRRGIPNFDVTADQDTALATFERLDAAARAAGVTVVPAMAFFGGLADLLVSAVAPDRADDVEVAVGLDSWHPTDGTRETGARNTAPRLVVRGGELVPVPVPPPTASWDFPEPLGHQPVTCVALSEIVLVARHIPVSRMTSYMNLAPLDDLHGDRSPEAVDERGRSAQRFIVDVRVHADGEESRATARGQDIYAVTAPIIVSACLALLADDDAPRGVRAPGEVFDARDFLAALAPDVTVTLP